MTVRVNKQPFNLREKLSELERPIGLKGSELMKSETAQEARDLVSAGRKNYIINGDFKVWQRGTSGGVGTGNRTYKSADRWFNFNGGDTTSQLDLTSENLGGVTGRFRYGMRVSGGQNSRILGQCIEGPLPAGDYIFSAWVRFSEIPVNFYMTHNSSALIGENNFSGWYGGSGTNVSYTKPDNVSEVAQTGVWYHVYKKFTAVSPYLGLGIAFQPIFAASTSATMDIAGVQVERVENSTKPTDFEYRSYGEELALCQRYFFMLGDTNNTSLPHASYYNNTLVAMSVQFPVTMRANPSIYIVDGTGYFGIYANNTFDYFNTFVIARPQPNCATLDCIGNGASGTAGHSGPGAIANSAARLGFNAEL